MNKQQFLEKIIEYSGLSPEVAEKELDNFIRLTAGVVKGNPVTIEDLGTFRLKKGRLSFETDPKLAVEINYKYAGMLPIEVKKSYQQNTEEVATDSEADSKNLQSNSQTNDDEKVAIGKVRELKKAEPVQPEKTSTPLVEEKPNVVTEVETVSQPVEETASSSVEKSASQEEIKTAEPNVVSSVETKPVQEKEDVRTVKPESTSKPSIKGKSVRKQDRSSISVWAIAATALIILAIIYALSQQSAKKAEPMTENKQTTTSVTSKQNSTSPTQETATVDKPMDLKENETRMQGKSDPINNTSLPAQITTTTPVRAETDKQEVVNDIVTQLSASSQPFYTIVIYTLSFESRAVQEVDSWLNKKYDSFVKPIKTKSGESRYLVCIGKFDSYKSAKDFVPTLPEPFNIESKIAIKRLTE